MPINLTIENLEEIESKYDELTKWVLKNYSDFMLGAFVLQSIDKSVKEAKTLLLAQTKENE